LTHGFLLLIERIENEGKKTTDIVAGEALRGEPGAAPPPSL
jgi:hypothetical protein